MSTERNPHEFTAEPGTAANDFADAAEGDLFIRDLPSTSTPAPADFAGDEEEGYDDEEEDEGTVTTMMLGEEGERGGGGKGDREDADVMTTLALGEEGRGE